MTKATIPVFISTGSFVNLDRRGKIFIVSMTLINLVLTMRDTPLRDMRGSATSNA